MHIELGILSAAKLAFANIGAIATLSSNVVGLIKKPNLIIKTAFAAIFVSGFMQIFHMPVGASELHFIGASAVYLLFGFLPTLFGFALGLLLQSLLFEPADMLHLGVNILSLCLPLIIAHTIYGKKFFAKENQVKINWVSIVKFDAIYYSGVITMVAFWLSLGNEPTPFLNWAMFAISYLPLVFIEPLFTFLVLYLAHHYLKNKAFNNFTIARSLKLS